MEAFFTRHTRLFSSFALPGRSHAVLAVFFDYGIGGLGAVFMLCIEYYGGTTQGVAAVFSALKQVGDIPVISLFSPEDIPGYVTSLVKDCPMCKAGQKIDALSNSYGFSPLT